MLINESIHKSLLFGNRTTLVKLSANTLKIIGSYESFSWKSVYTDFLRRTDSLESIFRKSHYTARAVIYFVNKT